MLKGAVRRWKKLIGENKTSLITRVLITRVQHSGTGWQFLLSATPFIMSSGKALRAFHEPQFPFSKWLLPLSYPQDTCRNKYSKVCQDHGYGLMNTSKYAWAVVWKAHVLWMSHRHWLCGAQLGLGDHADTGSVSGGADAMTGEIYTSAASTVTSLCTQVLTVPAMFTAGMCY